MPRTMRHLREAPPRERRRAIRDSVRLRDLHVAAPDHLTGLQAVLVVEQSTTPIDERADIFFGSVDRFYVARFRAVQYEVDVCSNALRRGGYQDYDPRSQFGRFRGDAFGVLVGDLDDLQPSLNSPRTHEWMDLRAPRRARSLLTRCTSDEHSCGDGEGVSDDHQKHSARLRQRDAGHVSAGSGGAHASRAHDGASTTGASLAPAT